MRKRTFKYNFSISFQFDSSLHIGDILRNSHQSEKDAQIENKIWLNEMHIESQRVRFI